MVKTKGQEKPSLRPTAGELLPDGSLLELVRDPSAPARLSLMRWDGVRAQFADHFELLGQIYVPITPSASTLEAVYFPCQPASYGSATQLFAKIVGVISDFFDLPNRDICLLAYWVLGTWFPDVAPTPVSILIASSSPAEISRLFRLLKSLCRYGIRLGEFSGADFRAMPMQLAPTLLIEQVGLTPSMRRLLKASSTPGLYIPRCGNFLNLLCTKAISCPVSGLDSDLAESMLSIPVLPTESASAILDQGSESRIADEFQPLLLDYRVRNHQAVRESSLDIPEFTPELRHIARSLMAAVVGDSGLEKQVVSLLEPNDEDARARRSTRPESAIVIALLALVHERKEQQMLVKNFTNLVNAILCANGEFIEYSPEKIGWQLSGLGLHTKRMQGGKAIHLDRDLSISVHALARKLGVSHSPANFPGCHDCGLAANSAETKVFM